jgi:hypothetical protein
MPDHLGRDRRVLLRCTTLATVGMFPTKENQFRMFLRERTRKARRTSSKLALGFLGHFLIVCGTFPLIRRSI